MTAPQGETGTLVRGGTWLAVAMGAMNIAAYGFTILAARLLGPAPYGALVALMNTLLVLSVFQLGLQATAARRISADPEHVGQIERSILSLNRRTALGIGLVMLALAPVIDIVLRLDNLLLAIVMALAAVPMTMIGGMAGILQGERRWLPLSLLYLANGVPRLLLGVALMLWQPTTMVALSALALSFLAPVMVGLWALRRPREAPGLESDHHELRPMFGELVHNSQALFAFFALSSIDVVVARNVLSEHESGLYAAGLILVKAVLFLPQFVVVVAFPAMSTPTERRRTLTRSVALVSVLGTVATAATYLLPDLALVFIGGNAYAEIHDQLWLFAVLGTALSLLQLLIYSVLARRGQRSSYLVWAALVLVTVAGLATDTLGGLLAVVIVIDSTLMLVLLGISLWLVKHPEPEPTEPEPT